MEKRQQWGTKIGFLLAAIGSTVGLGNIWKFPYVMGESGGALFLLIYLICVLLVGIPVLISELLIGKRNQLNVVDSLKKEFPSKPYYISGLFGLVTSVGILGFYIVVAGWCLFYTYASLTGSLDFSNIGDAANYFGNFISSKYSPLLWIFLFMVLNIAILFGGIKKGIERASKILMPTLVIILIVLVIKALTLGNGVGSGLAFMFKPDFSKISFLLILEALGLAFFKLSLGMGTMITYGSYMNKDDDIVSNSVKIAFWDTFISVLAGITIFPTIFALGFVPNGGPGLTFVTIPALLHSLPFGYGFGLLFFIALTVAALTSSISIFEVIISYFTERFKVSRKVVLAVSFVLVSLLGFTVSMTLGKEIPLFHMNLFDTLDKLTSVFLMPLGGVIVTIGVGWSLKRSEFFKELGSNTFTKLIYILIKYVVPIIIFLIFIYGINELFNLFDI